MDVEEVAALLTAQGKTVSVAEACTCGLVGYMLGTVPGSSRYFPGGVVAYTGGLKQKILGVPTSFTTPRAAYPRRWRLPWPRGCGN